MKNDTKFGQTMHSVKRILTTENRTCAIRPTAIESVHYGDPASAGMY